MHKGPLTLATRYTHEYNVFVCDTYTKQSFRLPFPLLTCARAARTTYRVL